MIKTILAIINLIIFFTLSLFHFYWAFGGKWGIIYTIPEKFIDNYFNEKYKKGTFLATLFVALGLLFMSLIMCLNAFDVESFISSYWRMRITQFAGILFLLRAIGDFNICGIFKKKSNSTFAAYDTKIFIPICVYLGTASLIISFLF